jgi:hypothetical protein
MNLQYIDCPTDHIGFEDIYRIEAYQNCLIVNQRSRLTIWDMSDPTDIKLLYEMNYPRPHWTIQLFDGQLFVWGSPDVEIEDTLILVLDISDPSHIKQSGEYKVKTGAWSVVPRKENSIVKIVKSKDRLLAIAGIGICDLETGKILWKKSDIGDFYMYEGYSEDWIAYDDFLIYANCENVRIFRIQPDGALTLLKHIESMYFMPDVLHWDVPGKSFILCGYDIKIFKFDMSVPEKTKRVKAAKADSDLCPQIIREDSALWAFGMNGGGSVPDKQRLFLYEVDVSDNIPVITAKSEIKGFPRKDYGPGFDHPRGMIKTGDYLILCTPYRDLGVVKIMP